jgi:hypothetical protein
MMKSKISDRPMFRKDIEEDEVENVGIMQGFMDEMEAEEEMENDEDYKTEKMLDRRPNSPEILMNNLRGDMRSIDARVEELADLVGYNAASETPEGVLALLQPVLAAQQAPQVPPQGMPPQNPAPQGMPPEMMGGMPPEAAMGGIGALSADQGPMMEPPMEEPMPAPVAMAMGGYVQRFSEGSDEDGVTPSTESSSFAPGTFSRQMIEKARINVLNRMNQPLSPIPDLESEVERRSPLYEKLMGVDPKLSQAQILFELGQRAFNYGANVDDQGRPLYGSPIARLSGAIRTLPGAMGNIVAQQEQQKRAVRGVALQAAEKDVQNIREQNTKLAATKQKLQSDVLKSSTAGSKLFGSGMEGAAQSLLVNLAPMYAKGETTPDQDRAVESAYKIITQPIQYIDQYTGNMVTRVPSVPDYVNEAFAARKKLGKTSPSLNLDEVGAVLPATPSDTKAKPDSGKAPKEVGALPGRTLWNSADLIAGPIPTGAAVAARVPGLGNVAPEMQQARSFVTTAVNDLVGNLRTNDRFTENERKEIKREIDIGPAFFDSPAALKNRMIGISEFLDKKLIDATAQAADTTLPVNIRKDAADRMSDMQKFKSTLGVPIRVYSLEDVQALPGNTPFLWNGTEPRVTNPKVR